MSSSAKSNLSKVVITNAGVTMPRLIYGTAWKAGSTCDLVVQAIRSGFRGVDTACQPKHYNEAGVGAALAKLAKEDGIERKSLFIQTKFTSLNGQDPKNIPYDKKAPLEEQVAQSFKRTQENLQTDYVDSLVLHGPLSTMADTLRVWRAMECVFEDGRAKQLGVSNFYSLDDLCRLWKEAKVKPAVLQNRFYEDTGHDVEIRKFCREKNIYYQSFWTLTANPHLLQSRVMNQIASKRKKTPEQVLFRFLIERGGTPLTGTKSQKHMDQDLDVLTWELEEEEVVAIGSMIGEPFDQKVSAKIAPFVKSERGSSTTAIQPSTTKSESDVKTDDDKTTLS